MSNECEICNDRFKSSQGLTHHISVVHDKKKLYKCSICNGPYFTKQDLKTLISAFHEGRKPHKCNNCGKTFSQV